MQQQKKTKLTPTQLFRAVNIAHKVFLVITLACLLVSSAEAIAQPNKRNVTNAGFAGGMFLSVYVSFRFYNKKMCYWLLEDRLQQLLDEQDID